MPALRFQNAGWKIDRLPLHPARLKSCDLVPRLTSLQKEAEGRIAPPEWTNPYLITLWLWYLVYCLYGERRADGSIQLEC